MDRVHRPWRDATVAANGSEVRDNFALWFGRSAIVDQNGAPLAVYHGTDHRFDVFEPSLTGEFGPGIYFACSVDSAKQYAEDGRGIIAAYLRIINPLSVRADFALGEQMDLDCGAVPLLQILYPQTWQEHVRALRSATSVMLGSDIQARVRALGHDGIVVEWDDGQRWFVVYEPSQVKSATENAGLYDLADPRFRDAERHSLSAAVHRWSGPARIR